MQIRLAKILAAAGVASRRASERLIEAGSVTVNGAVVIHPATHADPDKDHIAVNGESIGRPEKKVYFLLNKPKGTICSNRPSKNSKRVVDLFSHLPMRLFTVGRLDKDTTGLLIVTNDGHLAKKVIHPSSNISKEYLVKTAQMIEQKHILKLQAGTHVQGRPVRPYKIEKMRRGTLKITVKEGRKHEVRLLVRATGLNLLSLQRLRIGNLRLGHLPLGQFRELSQEECEQVFW